MIELQNLQFGYKPKRKWFRKAPLAPEPILKAISLKIAPGELFGLVGPNGCGKTTMAKLILGVYEPDAGQILVGGRPRPNLSDGTWKRSIGFVSGAATKLFSTMVLGEHVRLYEKMYERFDGEWFAARMAELKLEDKMKRWATSLSFGERIKFEMALTLACGPQVLILDEPTVGLDPAAVRQIRTLVSDYLEKSGACGILTSHNLKDITVVCERGGFLETGYITHPFVCDDIDAERLEEQYLEVFHEVG